MESQDRIKGVIYDLDGTIILTESLHAAAWKHAGREFGVDVTDEMLINQKGLTSLDASRMMLDMDDGELITGFKKTKQDYVIDNIRDIKMYPGFFETSERLSSEGKLVWICTSAQMKFLESVFDIFPDLREFDERVVTQGMYAKGKPDAEPLSLTLERMGGLHPRDGLFVGDAHNDYACAMNAGTRFVYFHPDGNPKDERMPSNIDVIKQHDELITKGYAS